MNMKRNTKHIQNALLLLLLLAAGGCSMFGKQSIPTGPSAGPGSSYHSVSVVDTARTVMGTRYTWGGDTPRDGFDCSGLIYWVYAQHGVRMPRPSWEQYKVGRSVARNDLRPGDLVFFKTRNSGASLHVGIVSGPGRFIHSPKAGGVVSETDMNSSYWRTHYLGAKRVM